MHPHRAHDEVHPGPECRGNLLHGTIYNRKSTLRPEDEISRLRVWGSEMKLDYELLRHILAHIEEITDGQVRHTVSPETFSDSSIQCESFDVLAYHFDILCLNGFVEGEVLRSRLHGYRVATNIDYFSLTFEGHKLVDSMRSQTMWNSIKSRAQEFGVEGLKQIPALAISLLINSPA